MDKYYEIQKVFSDFYSHEFLPSLKAEKGNDIEVTMGWLIKLYAVILFITILPFIPINNLPLPLVLGLLLMLLIFLSIIFLPLLVFFLLFLTIRPERWSTGLM